MNSNSGGLVGAKRWPVRVPWWS